MPRLSVAMTSNVGKAIINHMWEWYTYHLFMVIWGMVHSWFTHIIPSGKLTYLWKISMVFIVMGESTISPGQLSIANSLISNVGITNKNEPLIWGWLIPPYATHVHGDCFFCDFFWAKGLSRSFYDYNRTNYMINKSPS